MKIKLCLLVCLFLWSCNKEPIESLTPNAGLDLVFTIEAPLVNGPLNMTTCVNLFTVYTSGADPGGCWTTGTVPDPIPLPSDACCNNSVDCGQPLYDPLVCWDLYQCGTYILYYTVYSSTCDCYDTATITIINNSCCDIPPPVISKYCI